MKQIILTTLMLLGFIAASNSQNLPSYLPANGLVGWWPFNGNANDETGNGNNGTVNGATLTADRFGNDSKSYDFDGFDDFIEVPFSSSLQFTNSFSVSCWTRIDDYTKNENPSWKMRVLVGKPRSTQGSGFYLFALNESSPTYGGGMRNGYPDGYEVTANDTLDLNVWSNLTFTYDGIALKIYKNGVLMNEQYCGLFLDPVEMPLFFGKEFFGEPSASRWFKGQLDDIAIYNRALTTEEITTLYTGEPVTPPTACNPLPANLQNGLVGYWPFCGNANDESGNGIDGTVNGATLTEDRFGENNNSYNFDGLSNYIELPLLTEINDLSQLSFSMWLKSDFEFNELYRTAFAHWISSGIGSGAVGLQIALGGQGTINQGGVSSALIAGSGVWSADSLLTPNTWTQVFIIFDGTQSNPEQKLQLYVNGQFIGYYGNSSIPESTGNIAEKTVIGASVGPVGNNNTYNFFKGTLDDIGIWNRALSSEEVQQLYTLNACTFTIYDTVTVTETVYDTVTTYTSVTDTLVINTLITELAPPANSNTIKVFPNPANSHITIDYGNFALMSGYQLRIENSLGQQVFQTNISQQSDYLNLNTWGGNGLYFVHIIDPQGNTIDIRKIVLQ
jgi:hypothetical protein